MKPPSSLILGRAPDCDVRIDHPTVSSRHARLSWSGEHLLVEDLASANGTFVAGQRVQRALIRAGDEVLLGEVTVPWSAKSLQGFLRQARKGTLILAPGSRPPASGGAVTERAARGLAATMVLASLALLAAVLLTQTEAGKALVQRGAVNVDGLRASTDEERYVRVTFMAQLRRALDPTEPTVRNTAVQLASRSEGTFHVEQVAAIWTHVRSHWRYVNDPRGREYVALPKESIENNYAGDCDDFAVTLAAMVRSIGGEARVVFMEGPRGGHAYAEACVREQPAVVATKLARYYGRNWARYANARQHIAYRSSADCPVWLNLDWNASVPGGDYEPERWSVAAYADGRTEVLAVAPGAQPSRGASSAPVATAPRRLATRAP